MQSWTTDKELLNMAVGGNDAAIREMVFVLSADAHRLAWRILGSSDLAQDAVQAGLMKLWKSHQNFKGQSALKTYFYTIVQRICFDQLKENQKFWAMDDIQTALASDGIDIQNSYPNDELNEQVTDNAGVMQSAVHKLPPKQRIAIVLWAYHDYTAEEIGKVLDMNKNAVDQLLFRAKQHLKKLYEESN